MAAAANNPPRNSGTGDSAAALNSPKSKRGAAAARGVSSPPPPWSQVVQGAEFESIISSSASPSSPSASAAAAAALGQTSHSSSDWSPSAVAAPDDPTAVAQPESSDNCGGGAGSSNAGKKPAWSKPSNGAIEVGAVMGAVSWPALSESARSSPKPSVPDGSALVSEGIGIGYSSAQKQVLTNNTNPSSAPNHVAPTSHKPMRHGGGSSSGSVTANGGFPQPVPPPPLVVEMPSDKTRKPGFSVPETSPRDHTPKGSGQRGGFQSHSGNDHSQQRNSYRRGNGTPHPRSDGSYHHGGRQDHDRGNNDRNSPRGFNGRDSHMQPPRVVPRGFVRTPLHSSTPFLPPPPMPVRPFGNPMVYPDVAAPVIYIPVPPPPPPPDSLRGLPIVTPMPPPTMFFPVSEPPLHVKLVSQINYYFSNDNLSHDTFLRQNMDEDGWVPIELIAGFKKVKVLTNDIQFILTALQASDVVEVQNRKVRKRKDWRKWIMAPSTGYHSVSSPRSLERSSHEARDMLSTKIQSISLEEKTNKEVQAEAFLSRSFSGDLSSQTQLSSGEGSGQAAVQAGSEVSISARS